MPAHSPPHSAPSAAQPPSSLTVLVSPPWRDYALLDSGHGRKLERYGRVTVVRPEPQAMWAPRRPESEWEAADAIFTGDQDDDGPGRWRTTRKVPETWEMSYGAARFRSRLTNFRHLGVFPEQRAHWDWMADRVKSSGRSEFKVLNLFGYTGVASLVLAAAGAAVTHVDASKKAIGWARESQELSGLEDRPIRWICEDATKFVAREVRRGSTYDGILLDPPKFGRGPKGETWEMFQSLPPLLADLRQLVGPEAGFVVLTAYAIRASALAAHGLMAETFAGLGGAVESGDLALAEEGTGRLLPTSLFSRWVR
ncbi:class I SAM-dependent methyltransferase [Amorphus orientalis]|uniref:23S rRNA (Cytosine1962-C5)-methyltransferase n=1 Tax=Amorphus orientalis TaxID=649198 RepID=A0AAE3VSZ4_9HYPH|nr:class I SAM-dependent methyltransferase [Amorphus orientalis]MDQ0317647.1 23S rRNA (cytosine1962-C5)-methyltransferase [Amorphus orientalis]